ncbi:unnamed protein product [Phaeothamnion confervicola]
MPRRGRGLISIPNIPGIPNIPNVPNIPGVDIPSTDAILDQLVGACDSAGGNYSSTYVAPTFNPTPYIESMHNVPRWSGDRVWNIHVPAYNRGIVAAGVTIAVAGAVLTLLLGLSLIYMQKRGGCGVRRPEPKTAAAKQPTKGAAAVAATAGDGGDGGGVGYDDGGGAVATNTAIAAAHTNAPREAQESRRIWWLFVGCGICTLVALACMIYGLWESNYEVDGVVDQANHIADTVNATDTTLEQAIDVAHDAFINAAKVLAYGTIGCSGVLGTAADAVVNAATDKADSLQSDWQAKRQKLLGGTASDIYNIADIIASTKDARYATIGVLTIVSFLGTLLLALHVTSTVRQAKDQPDVPGTAASMAASASAAGGGVGGLSHSIAPVAEPGTGIGGGGGGGGSGDGDGGSIDFGGSTAAVSSGSRRKKPRSATRIFGRGTTCVAVTLLFTTCVILSAAFMSAIFAADYCIEPTELSINAFTSDSELTQEAVSYYTQCNGTDSGPIGTLLLTISCYADEMGGVVSDFDAGNLPNNCAAEANSSTLLKEDLLELSSLIAYATELSSCANVNPLFVELSFDTTCTDVIKFSLWVWLGGVFYFCLLMAYLFLGRAIVLRTRQEIKTARKTAAAVAAAAAAGAAAAAVAVGQREVGKDGEEKSWNDLEGGASVAAHSAELPEAAPVALAGFATVAESHPTE